MGTFLVVQWIWISLPMQGKWIWSLVQEDPTCNEVQVPQVLSLSSMRSATTETLKVQSLCFTRQDTAVRSLCTTIKSSPSSLQLEESQTKQWRHSTAEKSFPWFSKVMETCQETLHASTPTWLFTHLLPPSLGHSTPTTVHLSFTSFSNLQLKCFPSPNAYTAPTQSN